MIALLLMAQDEEQMKEKTEKCLEELKSGNQEFAKAERAIRAEIEKMDAPEVKYFMEHFAPSFALALDELN